MIALGGTISMKETGAGISPILDGADLTAAIPELERVAQVETVSPFRLPGASLTLEHMGTVASLVERKFAEGFDGAVIVQGTDTIEETAFALNCVLSGELPVVVTGAMRGPDARGSDGEANILAATVVAATPASRGCGVLVVLNDEIHSANLVAKQHTSLPSSFASPSCGRIGFVAEGNPHILCKPVRPAAIRDACNFASADVAICKAALGDDGRILGSLNALGYNACVIESMGAGHVPAAMIPNVRSLIAEMPVFLSTRVVAGAVFEKTYRFAGSEMDLIARGVTPTGTLNALKARILLQLLLAAGHRGHGLSDEFRKKLVSLQQALHNA